VVARFSGVPGREGRGGRQPESGARSRFFRARVKNLYFLKSFLNLYLLAPVETIVILFFFNGLRYWGVPQ
jgi:hypothetical protein